MSCLKEKLNIANETQLLASGDEGTLVQTSLVGVYEDAGGSGPFIISYITPPANNPVDANIPQYINIWAVTSADAIYSQDPIDEILIDSGGSTGSVRSKIITRAPGTTYIMGYSYGKFIKNKIVPIAATLTFEEGSNNGVPYSSSMTTPTIYGSSLVMCPFFTPLGNNPYKYNNWYGLAKGSVITNDSSQDWEATQDCDSTMTNNDTIAVLDNVKLQSGSTYSFAYGFSPDKGSQSVGMYYTFKVA